MQAHVVLSPNLVSEYDLSGKIVVVIDVLRATSTICAALNNGAAGVRPVLSVEEALEYQQNGHLVGGERNGVKIPEFDLGNSPRTYDRDTVGGKEVVLTTTNGTKCIRMSEGAEEIIAGSFLNLSAVCSYLRKQDKPFVLFCAGWKNKVNMEDTLFAGAVLDSLIDVCELENDASEMTLQYYSAVKHDLEGALENASHVNRFRKLGIVDEMNYCIQIDHAPVLPMLVDGVLRAK